MDISKTLADLREYKAKLDEAIVALDGLARRRGAKRGRPLGSTNKPHAADGQSADKQKSRRGFSAETRARMAESQRKRWAAARKSQG
jgi:hypothetical protein